MDESIFRKKSIDRISSPEALNDYLRVTTPTFWLILAAIILLLVGFLGYHTYKRRVPQRQGTHHKR